jgi:hypothetical protein
MKKLQIILFGMAILFSQSLSAEITREQADAIVFEYIQDEITGDYILFRNDNPPGEDGKTSVTWDNNFLHTESVSIEYPCLVYCLYDPTIATLRTVLFLFVNREDGSLLTVKNKQASGANPDNWTEIARTGATVEIEPVLIGKGEITYFEGFTIPNRIITSVEEWNELKTVMRDRVYDLNTFDETDVDFSAYQVIALFDEIRPNGGWSIDITGIIEYSDKIIVSVSNLKTGNQTRVLTQPYHIVKIPVSSKEIVFNSLKEPSPVFTVTDFNLPTGCVMNYAKMQLNSVYVINSEEEWAKIFTCERPPEIDFSTKTLLVAFGGTTNGVANIRKELLFENNTWSLTVDVTLNDATVAEGWHVILIANKINTQSIILNLNKHFGDGTPACLWEQITPAAPSNEQKIRLNGVFSDSNECLRNIRSDTLFVINNQEDMRKLQSSEYHDIWIDWDNYSIIGGKTVRPHGPNEILAQQLSKCLDTSSYKYEIKIKECILCYDAEEYLYFWTIYAQKPDSKNVSLAIKVVLP